MPFICRVHGDNSKQREAERIKSKFLAAHHIEGEQPALSLAVGQPIDRCWAGSQSRQVVMASLPHEPRPLESSSGCCPHFLFLYLCECFESLSNGNWLSLCLPPPPNSPAPAPAPQSCGELLPISWLPPIISEHFQAPVPSPAAHTVCDTVSTSHHSTEDEFLHLGCLLLPSTSSLGK